MTTNHVIRPRVFTSDNVAGASPEMIAAVAACNSGPAMPYGNDPLTLAVEQKLAEVFEREVDVFLVSTGSAANALALAAVTPPWGSVLSHSDAHINRDECGAPEFYTAGAKLVQIPGAAGKIDPDILAANANKMVGDVHSVQPSSASITQATEVGTLYGLDEIGVIGEICRGAGVALHMDGARFANALVTLGCSPAEMTWKAGVDLVSFGATKNGTFGVDAVVSFRKELSSSLAFRRKRAGQLSSKMRFMAAQMDAYLKDGLWLRNATHANRMAQTLAAGLTSIPGVEIQQEPQANILFCRLPLPMISGLLDLGFKFYHDRWEPGVVRFVTAFSTSDDEVADLVTQARAVATKSTLLEAR
ncbi:L-threonine aldolase [Novosphingobium sp. PhB55]|uniref:threonine aldolase family protein n=1 Tax=Novosphingobium sp. PhB55 TaxID=2485106 RepID=UPI00106586EC|nr:low specificity L-threonine aldolase [Novosphingobium sp. PhB55]TDW59965.1 L-threonine aldolase [Novosphingobium sp. PhB55]